MSEPKIRSGIPNKEGYYWVSFSPAPYEWIAEMNHWFCIGHSVPFRLADKWAYIGQRPDMNGTRKAIIKMFPKKSGNPFEGKS